MLISVNRPPISLRVLVICSQSLRCLSYISTLADDLASQHCSAAPTTLLLVYRAGLTVFNSCGLEPHSYSFRVLQAFGVLHLLEDPPHY